MENADYGVLPGDSGVASLGRLSTEAVVKQNFPNISHFCLGILQESDEFRVFFGLFLLSFTLHYLIQTRGHLT